MTDDPYTYPEDEWEREQDESLRRRIGTAGLCLALAGLVVAVACVVGVR